MKCAECQLEGKTSRVYPGGGFSTAMFVHPYYDEAGAYHRHDPNIHTRYFNCSEGHEWTEGGLDPCPAPGCDWAAREEEKRATRQAEWEARHAHNL